MPESNYVYMFSEGGAEMADILGAKGAHLAEMTKLSLPVPPGFTISCDACLKYFENPDFLDDIFPEIEEALEKLEELTGKKFGDDNGNEPLLVSVRSGAPRSMPGMMDTVLNVGITDINLKNLAEQKKNEIFALDTYRRFIEMFSDIAMGINRSEFEKVYSEINGKSGINNSIKGLGKDELAKVIKEYKKVYDEYLGGDFPDDPKTQLYECIRAVFESWNRTRSEFYRKHRNIPNTGTACTIQAMVYGNLNDSSFTGVAFTRDPSTGEKIMMGEYLNNAQGEDVLTGISTPKKIQQMEEEFPKVYSNLKKMISKLENHYRNAQDIEFTAENGELFLLQTRTARRTAVADVKIAIDMMHEGLISKEEAILRIDPNKLAQYSVIDDSQDIEIIASGLNASPGAVSGRIVFESEDAEFHKSIGNKVILIRPQTKPDDIHGLIAAEGLVTERGGKTSHAIVLARGMGKPAICGVHDIHVNADKKYFSVGRRRFKEGDFITIDGTLGIIVNGIVPLIEPKYNPELKELLEIADKIKTINVRVNVESPEDALKGLELGAEGIGLTRTEHMFNAPERLPIVKEMIIARSNEEREKILSKLKPMQKEDFRKLFNIMNGKPVTIRLLDPPIQEFLPAIDDISIEVSILEYKLQKGEDVEEILKKKKKSLHIIKLLHETHPMLGMRGSRLGIIWPNIYDGQVEAIFEAACELFQEGIDVKPEILVPFIGFKHELMFLKERLTKIAGKIIKSFDVDLDYKFGTMIEVPRSALIADELAEYADFFSFGTNDLTQMTLAFSRIDAEEKFLPKYLEKKVIQNNPFEVLDWKGTGKLIKIAVEDGRKSNKNLICGVTGEHASNVESIEFFQNVGMDYLSCEPLKVPVVRLAAAQAKLKQDNIKK